VIRRRGSSQEGGGAGAEDLAGGCGVVWCGSSCGGAADNGATC